jgi:Cu2+-exporting ATPase
MRAGPPPAYRTRREAMSTSQRHERQHERAPVSPPAGPSQPRPAYAAPGARHAAHDQHGAHDTHAGHSVEMFRDRFWLTLALTVPTLLWSHELQEWLRYTAPVFPGSAYVPAFFGTAVYVYGGRVFLQGAMQELRHRLPGMMTHRPGHHRRVRLQSRGHAWLRRNGALVGAVHTRDHHAARALD